MESKFGKNSKTSTSKSTIWLGWYGWKIKTGSKKTKLKSPKIKTLNPVSITTEAKPRKSKEKMERIPSNNGEHNRNTSSPKNQDESIPTWVRESSEKKPTRKEWEESKLQWRKINKKSQRSFSKNKERDYIAGKSKYEINNETSRKRFWISF